MPSAGPGLLGPLIWHILAIRVRLQHEGLTRALVLFNVRFAYRLKPLVILAGAGGH